MPHDVFISYSHQDSILMVRISYDLRASGLTIWSDVDLNPGTESWRKAIEDAIDEADCLVVIFSPDAKESKWVTAELDYATTQRKPIFPVLARGDEYDAVPFGFSTAQWIDVRDTSRYAHELPKLINAVRNRNVEISLTAGHAKPSSRHHIPIVTTEKLDPWNLLDQLHLISWLFLFPAEYVHRKITDQDRSIPKTGGWIISLLCWLPLFMPILGYTMGTVRVSNPLANSQVLVASYAVYFVAWTSCAVIAGYSNIVNNLLGFVVAALLSILSYFIMGGVGGIFLVGERELATFLLLSTTCISFGYAAGLSFIVSNGGAGIIAGIIAGSFVSLILFNIPIGVSGGISGFMMAGIAVLTALALDQAIKRKQSSWLTKGLLLLGVVDYAVMFWIFLLGGWFVIARL
jgi:hypothetical protein